MNEQEKRDLLKLWTYHNGQLDAQRRAKNKLEGQAELDRDNASAEALVVRQQMADLDTQIAANMQRRHELEQQLIIAGVKISEVQQHRRD